MQNPRTRFTTSTTIGPIISAGCALLIVLGSMQPWQRTLSVATNGSEIERGFWCLILGVVALVFSFGRAFASIPRTYYLGGIFLVAAIALGLSSWYYYDIKQTPTGELFGFQFEIATLSSGIYLSLSGEIALLVAALVQAVKPVRPVRPQVAQAPVLPAQPMAYQEPMESRETVAVASADN